MQEAKDVGDEFLALEKFVNLNYMVSTPSSGPSSEAAGLGSQPSFAKVLTPFSPSTESAAPITGDLPHVACGEK